MTLSLDQAARLHTEPVQPVPGQLAVDRPTVPDGLTAAFAERSRPVPGGHREWTGRSFTASGAGRFSHRGTSYTAGQAAFIIRTGRRPVGPVFPTCDLPHCCAPEHVDDSATRQRDRAAYAAVSGIAHRPPACGHDPAVHGRHRGNGKRYCNACTNPREDQQP